ncbi:hypothetical protein A3C28_04140 [Candidatus Roizmanbacteria bacterium RIFCSPHIGHO2_02_FULL_39_9]|uniref:LytR/CpsA/Psr regulator C-terminal domain-containing protein n=1 Tax=Candidatus Roizmanbacteria bacterium RIFCSPHIGHO2_02_FULL_39_9 TaxID=1802040 RepID=A0A1F7HBP8_9BACT|nr:MAG: hypothetical protein A3C28_04140 [Candidatus Roizmanbacteria bacterium RIFCSPHIGHO2_02_FULL_39_9]
MLYLFIDKNQVKALSLKKSLLGQYETSFFSKTYQSDLFVEGKISSIDYVASAVKEALEQISKNGNNEKNTILIIPQETYSFLRFEVPSDIVTTAMEAFIRDKVKSELPINLDESAYDYFSEETKKQKFIHFYAIKQDTLLQLKEALALIDLKLDGVLPESVCYFTLFQKTLRKDKKENIYFVNYEKGKLTGFLYDSFGQTSSEKWQKVIEEVKIEKLLKQKTSELEKKGVKLNRLILAGEQSEKIRQDTFTKEIGVWTNPLKRIIPEFYQDYLKILTSTPNTSLKVLSYEACIGAFIFNQQRKNFSLASHSKKESTRSRKLPQVKLPLKGVLLFVSSFVLSFILFFIVSQFKFKLPEPPKGLSLNSTKVIAPTSPPKPSPTPTLVLKKEEVKIKILNGSGTPGKASEVRDLLKEKGYQELLTGNADNFDYTKSELQVKKGHTAAADVLKADLKENITSFKQSALNEDETADIILIIGQDFK